MPKNVKCKNCDKLKNHWCRAVIDSPDEDIVRDCRHFRHKTNADKIRAMTNEELSDFLCGIAYAGAEKWSAPFMREFCDKCPTVEGVVSETGQKMKFYECDFKDGKCPHGSDILWWLQQPVEDDNV